MSGLRLHRLDGEASAPLELTLGDRAVIGREPGSAVRLEDLSVSRRHALVQEVEGRWTVCDLGSRHGTRLNGALLHAQLAVPISHGDRIDIRPCSLRVDLGAAADVTLMGGTEVASRVRVREVSPADLQAVAQRRLALLLESAAAIHTAETETALAEAALDACLEGSGFRRALLLRSVDGLKTLEVLCARPESDATAHLRVASRTLVRAAAQGNVVCLDDDPDFSAAESIISSGVTSAVCIPVLLDGVAERFIYLDGPQGMAPANDAAAYCNAVGHMCALALSRIKLAQVELHRHELLEELGRARAAQERIMPPNSGSIGSLRYTMASVPGMHVAGDIFGLSEAPEGPVFFLGDVTGKGLGPAMLMAGIQAHLDAQLRGGVTLNSAADALSTYVNSHVNGMEFATLFLAAIDPARGVARLLDAGHGYAILIRRGEAGVLVQAQGGPPIGAVSDFAYSSVEAPFVRGDRLVLFSDGLAEQRDLDGNMLGIERVIEALAQSTKSASDVELLMALLARFAGGATYSDDVTIASLEWKGLDETVGP